MGTHHSFSYPDFSQATVLVIGDIMLDRYWHGDTSRISPEAPVPVVKIDSIEDRLGGAANVALNIRSLGAQVTLMGIIGDDEAGRCVREQLQAHGIGDALSVESIKTITKLRVMGRSQQLLRCDFEQNGGAFQQKLLELAEPFFSKVDVVVLSDYAKGALADPRALIQRAKHYGVKVLVDPKSKDLSLYAGATLITPNLHEFELAEGVCANEVIMQQKAEALIERSSFDAVLVTRSAEGMSLFEPSRVLHVPSQAREVFDITGAGDTVIAVIAAALGAEKTNQQAVRLANLAGGIVVGKLGTATVSNEELYEEWLQSFSVASESHKLLSEDVLEAKVKRAKAAGETIVMTNGCFDILHVGHASYLKQAKRLGDKLIVAVNDDASVSRLKGPTRPINTLASRMELLAALGCVDWVVKFSEDTPLRIITKILPNILVKAADYRKEEVVGGDIVVQAGGSVEIIDLVPGFSTTQAIEKIQVKPKTEVVS